MSVDPQQTRSRPEELFSALLDAAVEAIIVIDDRGLIRRVNRAASEIFGYTAAELIGQNVKLLMPDPDASLHDGYLDNYQKGGAPQIIGIGREVTAQRKGGTTFPIYLSVGESNTEVGRFYVGILRDLSERQQLRQELYEREVEVRGLFENALVGTAALDSEGRILAANDACSKILGIPASKLVGRTLFDFATPSERASLRTTLESLTAAGGTAVVRNHTCVNSDGELKRGDLHIASVVDTGSDKKMVVQFVDRSEQIAAEREARESRDRLAHLDRVGSLGEMAAGIAHEVNQPLGAIQNYAQACRFQLKQAKGGDLESLDQTLEKISSQAKRAAEVVQRLRALATPGTSESETASMNDLVREVAELAEIDSRDRGVAIELELDPSEPLVRVDLVQIQQVILNLLRNGIDAMCEAGEHDRAIVVKTTSADGRVRVSVSDAGSGISDEHRPYILQPFYTSKASGMGMGLAICETIVSAHEGRLWFSSNQPEPGTTFTFELGVASPSHRGG